MRNIDGDKMGRKKDNKDRNNSILPVVCLNTAIQADQPKTE